MTEITTKEIFNYLENTDIIEVYKQIIDQLETAESFVVMEKTVSKQDLEQIFQQINTRQDDRPINDLNEYSNIPVIFWKYSQLKQLFIDEYYDLNQEKSKIAYQFHAFLFLEIWIDKILNSDFTQFWYSDEKVNQSLQNAFYFVIDEEKLIDWTLEYDKSVYDLVLRQYEMRWYVIQKTNNHIDQMEKQFEQTQLKNYNLTKTKKQVWKVISYISENKKIPENVKEYFERDYNETIKQLWELKEIEKLVKSGIMHKMCC